MLIAQRAEWVTQEGDTALALAVQKGHCEIVKCLAQWKGTHMSIQNKLGETAVMSLHVPPNCV